MRTQNHAFLGFRAILAIIIFFSAASVSAQVDRDELQGLPPVVFINYEGPHARIDTREEIRQLGVVLGQNISEREKGLEPALAAMSIEQRRQYSYLFQTGALNRYFVIHSVSGPEDGKFDADIFGLGVDAGVDHIRNLRTIIQGYLQTAYDYSESDARLLAEYITIYNAVYRGNWDFFVSRYKTPVINNLVRDRAGLSIRYDEWPGRTLMLIPLGTGGIGAVDTSAIMDRRVIEELRREEDQGVPQRQGMVEIMEREADRAEQRAQVEREVIREQERQITEERRQTEQERQSIEQERQSIEQERQRIQEDLEAGRITEEEARQAQQELDRREQGIQQRQQEIEQREQETDRRQEDVEQRREEAQRLEDFAEERMDQAQQQREEIARDQQAAIVQETTGGVLGITIEKQNPPMGRLIRFDPVTGNEIRRSPLDSVHVRTVTFIGGKILAIAGENIGSGAVRLIEINQTNLIMARQGDDDIMTGSLLWVNGSDLYAITVDLSNNACYLGRFDTNLALQAKSSVRVHREASVAIQQGYLLSQREDGSVLILNPSTLDVFY
ncbi:MAG: hypothetical protein LBI12_06995 [Treponema sp.]|nr:hypothetical protein [Treponema sp.]